MILLVTDTSGNNGFVGLARASDANPDTVEVLEEVPLAGGTFSAQLVPQIAGLLEKHGFRKADIDAFIVVSGPGSFTGLRVGLAAIKALAEILQKPIVPVSLLEVIALASRKAGGALAALDAGRGEVYVGEYECAHGSAELQQEQLLPKAEFLSSAHGLLVCTPDAALAEMARAAGLSVCGFDRVTPAMIATLGWRKLRAGATVSPQQLDANYIRRSDAEIFSKPK